MITVTQGSMRGQRVTVLLVVLTLVASLVTADRTPRRRARHRENPGLTSDKNSTVQVLLNAPQSQSQLITIKYLTIPPSNRANQRARPTLCLERKD